MSVLCPTANMAVCRSKSRCLKGPCAGRAYNDDFPCPDGYQFMLEDCTCEPMIFTEPGLYRAEIGIVSGRHKDGSSPDPSVYIIEVPEPSLNPDGLTTHWILGMNVVSRQTECGFDNGPYRMFPDLSGTPSKKLGENTVFAFNFFPKKAGLEVCGNFCFNNPGYPVIFSGWTLERRVFYAGPGGEITPAPGVGAAIAYNGPAIEDGACGTEYLELSKSFSVRRLE